MKGIKLTQGQFAIVDEEDYYYLNEFKWYFYRRRNQVYAKTCVTINKKRVHLLMHRLIMDASKKCVDHINGNGLDNRKSNLRLCERHENALNRVINYNNVSGYKGVSWFKVVKKWRAQIQYKKVVYHLGCFEKRIDAAKAYNEAAIKYHGEFANLNKID
jgi:uncharacterized Rmd1/YagE family protein